MAYVITHVTTIFVERQKNKSGETVVLKLKDCPSGEDFKTMMPARYDLGS